VIQLPSAVMLAAFLLIGPFGLHHLADTLVLFSFMGGSLAVALTSSRSSHQQSVALTLALAVLFYESLQSVTSWLRIELTVPVLGERSALHAASLLFTMNVFLALIGAGAAVIVAISMEVRKTRLPLASLFPEVSFLTAPSDLIGSVAEISRVVGIAPPKVSLIDTGDPAAFITRSRQGFELAVSVGLIESLTWDELRACIAHELAHVKNNDFAVRFFATSARVALFAHPLSHLIEPALYRAREFLADRTAVQLTGGRESLISALTKIRESQDYSAAQSGSIATACLFRRGHGNRFARVFDKHPSLNARIKALKELE